MENVTIIQIMLPDSTTALERGRMLDMGSNERGLVVSGGFTGSLTVIAVGFKLAFPNMDVPFGWALAILGAGLIGLISTIVFALRVYVWPFKSDRQRNIAVLQHALLAHNALSYKLMNVRTDAELDVVEREYKITSSTTLKAILENVGVGAASKYVSGAEQQLRLTWQGEHSPEHRQKHIVMLQRVKLRIQNIEEMMGSDKWDDPVPLRKRKQSNEWKHLVQEFDKMLADGLRE